MIRTCDPSIKTRITHTVMLPPCCPVSGNPLAGSTLSLTYSPTAGVVLPVEDLAAMVSEYVGGLGSIRAMEEMIQHIAVRCAGIVGVAVDVRAELVINPPFGGDNQKMIVECRLQSPAKSGKKDGRG
jgi:hypothetical protein